MARKLLSLATASGAAAAARAGRAPLFQDGKRQREGGSAWHRRSPQRCCQRHGTRRPWPAEGHFSAGKRGECSLWTGCPVEATVAVFPLRILLFAPRQKQLQLPRAVSCPGCDPALPLLTEAAATLILNPRAQLAAHRPAGAHRPWGPC